MTVVKTHLILTMTALDFAIMTLSVRPNQFMAYIEFGSSPFKQQRQIAFAVREPVCELKTVVCSLKSWAVCVIIQIIHAIDFSLTTLSLTFSGFDIDKTDMRGEGLCTN